MSVPSEGIARYKRSGETKIKLMRQYRNYIDTDSALIPADQITMYPIFERARLSSQRYVYLNFAHHSTHANWQSLGG